MTENQDDICDIDALADLLDEDEFQSSSSAIAIASQPSESDVLKKKLEEMEKQMALLKDQLKSQKEAKPTVSLLKDVGLDFKPTPERSFTKPEKTSLIHTQESESSEEDEEGNRTVKKYNEFGQFVKQRMAHQPTNTSSSSSSIVDRLKGQNCSQGWKTKSGSLMKLNGANVNPEPQSAADNGFTDPFFGIKIINPLIGSSTLMQRMEGRKQIKVSQIKMHMRGGDIKDDWVTMAVVVSKSEPRTSQKGKKYSIWKLSDLKDCTKQVSFFLFGEVYNTHWKMAVGSVIGILNPNFMKESNSEEISFTIDHHQKVLHIGGSKDLGWCRANRKDGSKCPSYVNKSECEFCIYHVQNEFKKSSAKRSEIQSHFSGTGLSTKDRLKQKVLGKEEVFYGGQIFSGKIVAPPASKAKDNKILDSLKMQSQALRLKEEEENLAKKNIKTQFSERLLNPTAGSRNLLRCLEAGKSPKEKTPTPSPTSMKSITAKELLQQHQQKLLDMKTLKLKASEPAAQLTPQLGRGLGKDQMEFDLSDELRLSKPHPRAMTAKLKALQLVRNKGPLERSDPNNPIQKPTTPQMQARIRKRALNTSADESTEIPGDDGGEATATLRPSKRSKVELEGLLEAKSSHANLVDDFENQQSELYFNKLERKEQMETKMLDTFEIKTTAVTCSKCNYTALSASELCRREGHPIRTIKAVKRFFQCKDCKQRTISLDRLPKRPCTHCGSSSWEKAAMAKERKGPVLPTEELLLRGEERKNLNC